MFSVEEAYLKKKKTIQKEEFKEQIENKEKVHREGKFQYYDYQIGNYHSRAGREHIIQQGDLEKPRTLVLCLNPTFIQYFTIAFQPND